MTDIDKYIEYLDSLNINFENIWLYNINIKSIKNIKFTIYVNYNYVYIENDKDYLYFTLLHNEAYNNLIFTTNKLLKPYIRKQKLNDLIK